MFADQSIPQEWKSWFQREICHRHPGSSVNGAVLHYPGEDRLGVWGVEGSSYWRLGPYSCARVKGVHPELPGTPGKATYYHQGCAQALGRTSRTDLRTAMHPSARSYTLDYDYYPIAGNSVRGH